MARQRGEHIDWHARYALDPVSGLLPYRVQLFAEVVAQAWLRLDASSQAREALTRPWISAVVDLSAAARFLLDGA